MYVHLRTSTVTGLCNPSLTLSMPTHSLRQHFLWCALGVTPRERLRNMLTWAIRFVYKHLF